MLCYDKLAYIEIGEQDMLLEFKGEEIWELFEEACVADEKGDYKKAFNLLVEMWELLPGEKVNYAESWVVVSTILQIAIENKDEKVMRKWVDKIDEVCPDEYELEERLYFRGRVAYEFGDFDKAREYLDYANKKTKGRCFSEKDRKYVIFLSKKNK